MRFFWGGQTAFAEESAHPRSREGAFEPLAESLQGQARKAYRDALLLYEDGDYAGAAAKFEHAYRLARDPRLLWNMAACEKEQRHYARTSTLVERYLAEGGERLPNAQREAAGRLLASLRSFSSELSLRGLPRGASLHVDGQKIAEAPLTTPVFLDLGKRRLRVEAPGYLPFARVINVAGGDTLDVQVDMKRDTSSARLVIIARPAETIRIDDRIVGDKHWDGRLPPGTHVVRVTAAGKKPFEATLSLAPQSYRTLQVTLENDPGRPLWPWLVAGGAVVAGAAVVTAVVVTNSKSEVHGVHSRRPVSGTHEVISPAGAIRWSFLRPHCL